MPIRNFWPAAPLAYLRGNPQLAIVGLSLFIGMLASSFLSLYIAVDFARQGFWPITTYFETWLIPADLLLFPAFFIVMRKRSPRSVIWAASGCQVLGMVMLTVLHGRHEAWIIGPLVALFATGYWQINQLAMAAHTTRAARGFEVSFLAGVAEVGALIGASTAALLSAMHLPFAPQYIAFVLQAAATLMLGLTLPKASSLAGDDVQQGGLAIEPFWACFRRFPRQNLGIAVGAVHELAVVMLLATWLVSSGYQVITLGGLRVGSSIATFLLAPLCGRLIHRQQGGEFKLASGLGVLAWLLVLTVPHLAGVAIAALIWPLSAFFMRTGLESRYFSRRSSTQILVRQVILALVRLPTLPVLCWFATRQTHLYPVAGIVVAVLILPYGIYLLRSEKERAL
jgi:hypothetical protein